MQGQYGSSVFNYVKIGVIGCDPTLLEEGEECLPYEEVSGTGFNFVHLRAHPSLIGNDEESVVSFSQESVYFKQINVGLSQRTNLYIMKSVLRLKDNIFDIYDLDEKQVNLFEPK